METNLEIKTERSPESLIPAANINNGDAVNHPNAERLEEHLAKLHPSKRAAYLETAYIRAIKELPDNNADNYIPATLLTGIIERWMPDSQDKYRKISYLKFSANRTESNNENITPYSVITKRRRQLKALFAGQKADFF